jgi:hypothetical protein
MKLAGSKSEEIIIIVQKRGEKKRKIYYKKAQLVVLCNNILFLYNDGRAYLLSPTCNRGSSTNLALC